MSFRNFALGRKLAVGFGAVLAVVAISSVFTVVEVRSVTETKRLDSVSDDAVDRVDRMIGDLGAVRMAALRLIITGDPAQRSKAQSALAELNSDEAALKATLVKDGPQLLPDFADYASKIETLLQKVVMPQLELASEAVTRAQAAELVTAPANAAVSEAVDTTGNSLRDKINTWSDSYTEAGNRGMDEIAMIAIGAGVISVLLGLGMAWLITRAIGGPLSAMTETMRRLAGGDTTIVVPALGQTDEVGRMAEAVQVFKTGAVDKIRLAQEASEARTLVEAERARTETERAEKSGQQGAIVTALATGLQRLAEGDLTIRLTSPFAAEYETLRGNFNAALETLAETMSLVSANAVAMHSGTSEISSASDDLSRRTEQQAASLEETTAALGEITSTVRKTADGANHARKVVSAAKTNAEQSGVIVGQAVGAMGGIETSSGQIGQIISVIDEIAFQTNLLALNAGVEAARAGDAGRGFAVVASEVRALAQRSAEAAKEIKTLIQASSQHVAAGVSLVGQTGKALESIVAQITEINDVVIKIAGSTQEQSTALDQINTAVVQMDQVTQQNAAMVEEATAASHTLAQEADTLTRLVGRFRTGQEQATEGRAPPRKAAAHAPTKPRPAPVAALKTVGRGGAARSPAPAASGDEWEEF